MSTIALAVPASSLSPIGSSARAMAREWQPVCIARLHYHLTWSTRGKSPVLVGKRALALRTILSDLCRERGIQLQALAITPGQVRMVVSLRPSQLAASIVRELKGRSALALLRQCPDVRVALGGHLAWNDRYALATVSPRQLPRLSEKLKNL
ncbi:MAG: IS200/IS605 family transposase [Candidatus Eisenbacteria bacterium]